jgi:hypothetical protein
MAISGPKVLVVEDDQGMREAEVSSAPRPHREEG